MRIKEIIIYILLIFSVSILIVSCANASTYQDAQKTANINVTRNHEVSLKDPTYPIYHLRAPSGWINDPCGLFYFNSSFHIFCQSNPWSSQWGNMTWSHIVSVPNKKFDYKWFYPKNEKGIYQTSAIMQSLNQKAPDSEGIFTGSIAILPYNEKDKNGKTITVYYPTAAYSGVWGIDESKQEVVCFARALKANLTDEDGTQLDPFLSEWTKYSTTSNNDPNNNPDIIVEQPAELNLVSFRDPFIFQIPNDKNYYMLISGGITNVKKNKPTGTILLYKNSGQDITKNWTRVNKGNKFFFSDTAPIKDDITGGGDFECATLHRLTDHIGTTNNTPYILIYGHDGQAAQQYGKSIFYLLGNIKRTDSSIYFEPLEDFKGKNGEILQKHIDLNPNMVFYASNLLPMDNEQRKYLIGWLNVGSQANNNNDYKWSGVLSIPRFLFVYKEGNKWKLGQEPILVNALRKKDPINKECKFNNNLKEETLQNTFNRNINIVCSFEAKDLLNKSFGLKILGNNNKFTEIKINKGSLVFDNKKPINLNIPEESSKISLNIYIDGSTIEIFISKYLDGIAIPYTAYSSPLPNNGNIGNEIIKIFGDNNVKASVTIYKMDTCWAEMPK